MLSNQALGISPILLSMVLDLYVSHVASFIAGVLLTLLALGVLHLFVKRNIYQFLLLPTLATYICYSVFLFFDIGEALGVYSPLIAEILLVSILGFASFFKQNLLLRVNDLQQPHQLAFRITLTEAFLVAEILQTLYTLYLFAILLYTHLPEASFREEGFIRIFYHYAGALIGITVIIYEEIRLRLLHRKLEQEIWVPILDNRGRAIGKVPYWDGLKALKKYYHPVVRIAVVHRGMLYLNRRADNSIVSPGLLDYPFHRYVLYSHSMEQTVQDITGKLGEDSSCEPQFLIHYTFRNDKVNQLVYLYAITLRTEEQLKHLSGGKLWPTRQIEDNIRAGIFSEYFNKELPYLQTTVLLAEKM
jgi:hypothetical protein